MGEPSIPSSIADVTPAWMTDVLHQAGTLPDDGSAAVLRPVQIGEGVGIMGEIHRVAIDYEGNRGDAPDSVVVKLPSTFEDNRQQGIDLGIYESEVRFYAELTARTKAGLPAIHLSKIVPGTADFVIVMEDLSHLELVDQATGMNPEQARAAVRVLAAIHAAWWDQVHDAELEWIPTMIGPRIEAVNQLFGQVWPLFLERFGDHLPEGGAELGELFSTRYLELCQGLASRAPWTLAHQDFRVENLLFGDPAADEVYVIDWQSIARGPGAYDLSYVLGGSMPIEDRRVHETDLLEAYHHQLTAHGVEGYSFEQCCADYGYAQSVGGLAVTVFAGASLDLANERGRRLVESMTERHFTAALDHGGMELMT